MISKKLAEKINKIRIDIVGISAEATGEFVKRMTEKGDVSPVDIAEMATEQATLTNANMLLGTIEGVQELADKAKSGEVWSKWNEVMKENDAE